MDVISHPPTELEPHTERGLVLAAENLHAKELTVLHRIAGDRVARVAAEPRLSYPQTEAGEFDVAGARADRPAHI